MTAPWSPPPDAIQWDCPDCGAGLWLTELEAAKGCPVDHPELCGAALVKRAGVVRCCRLDVDECARRCTGKPGGCDTYGAGLEPDGLGCRVAGRSVVIDEDGGASVVLDLQPREAPWRASSFAFFRDEAHALALATSMAARGYRVSVCHDLLDAPVVLGERRPRPL